MSVHIHGHSHVTCPGIRNGTWVPCMSQGLFCVVAPALGSCSYSEALRTGRTETHEAAVQIHPGCASAGGPESPQDKRCCETNQRSPGPLVLGTPSRACLGRKLASPRQMWGVWAAAVSGPGTSLTLTAQRNLQATDSTWGLESTQEQDHTGRPWEAHRVTPSQLPH